jgi:hypothetical protein
LGFGKGKIDAEFILSCDSLATLLLVLEHENSDIVRIATNRNFFSWFDQFDFLANANLRKNVTLNSRNFFDCSR